MTRDAPNRTPSSGRGKHLDAITGQAGSWIDASRARTEYKPPATMAWRYGPSAPGAASVEIAFLVIGGPS